MSAAAEVSDVDRYGEDLSGADLRGSDLSALDPRRARVRGARIDLGQAVVLVSAIGLRVEAGLPEADG